VKGRVEIATTLTVTTMFDITSEAFIMGSKYAF
jgi:hypothetical protein